MQSTRAVSFLPVIHKQCWRREKPEHGRKELQALSVSELEHSQLQKRSSKEEAADLWLSFRRSEFKGA